MSAAEQLEPQYHLVLVPIEHLPKTLPMVADKLQEIVAQSRGRWTVPGIIDLLMRDKWQLWIIWDGTVKAVGATELHLEMSGMKTLAIPFLIGEGSKDWGYIISELEDWARREGAQQIGLTCRKGWIRGLSERFPDYKMTHVRLEKDLV